MRKDSEIFLEKCLQYRGKIGKDAFEIGINYFSEIPNIEVEIDDIIEELKGIDIGNLTPMEALNTLYNLQNKIKNRW